MRQCYRSFDGMDSLMIAMVGMVFFLSARQASLFPDRSARLANALQVISWPIAMIVALALTDAFEPGGQRVVQRGRDARVGRLATLEEVVGDLLGEERNAVGPHPMT